MNPPNPPPFSSARDVELASRLSAGTAVPAGPFSTSDQQSQSLLEWLSDACFSVDDEWRFTEVSDGGVEYLGVPRETLLGRVLWEAFPVARGTPFEAACRDSMRTRRPARFVGKTVEHLDLHTEAYFHPRGNELRIYYRDVAQSLADQLRALVAELTRVEQRERRRLALVLHDHIQQLLVAAQMQIQSMMRNTGPGEAAAAGRVAAILDDAIQASRTLSVELSPPVLHQYGLAGGLAWLKSHLEEKHEFVVHLRVDPAAQSGPGTEEVRFLFFELAKELLFNAIKHSGVTEADVELARSDDGRVRLTVEDRGCGFDSSAFQAGGARGGFGLFSIQQRLAHFGGWMEIETGSGSGTRVTLVGPREEPTEGSRDPQAGSAEPLSQPEPSAASGQRIRILLVDDHKIVREGLASLLRSEPDLEIVGETGNPADAIQMVASAHPNVVVLDVNLPEMKEAGASAYLLKGGPATDLIDAIRASVTKA